MLVGQIATYWTTVEDEMIEILRDLSGGHLDLPARQIFRSITSNEARRKLLLNLLEKSPLNKGKGDFYDTVISSFYSLNGRRNDYVHGMWFTLDDYSTAFLSSRSIDDLFFLEKREVPIHELEVLIRDMDSLMGLLKDHRVQKLCPSAK